MSEPTETQVLSFSALNRPAALGFVPRFARCRVVACLRATHRQTARLFVAILVACWLGMGDAAYGQNPSFSLKVVTVNDEPVPRSNAVTVHPGDVVEVGIFVANWSPSGQELATFQASILRSSFTSGAQGVISPLGWDRPPSAADDVGCVHCLSDLNCALSPFGEDFPICGPDGVCVDLNGQTPCLPEFPVCDPLGFCVGDQWEPSLGAFIDDERPDWVFAPCRLSGGPCRAFGGVDTASKIRFGAAVFAVDALAFSPPEKYCGTLKLIARDDALGTFQFTISEDPFDTLLLDSNGNQIEPLDTLGLTIDVVPPPPRIPAASARGLAILTLSIVSIGCILSVRRARA